MRGGWGWQTLEEVRDLSTPDCLGCPKKFGGAGVPSSISMSSALGFYQVQDGHAGIEIGGGPGAQAP